MKFCHQCGAELPGTDFNYCPKCGVSLKSTDAVTPTEQSLSNKGNQAAVVALCTLTIIGSAYGLTKDLAILGFNHSGPSYNLISPHENRYTSFFTLLSIVCNIGTLWGAIVMLKRKLKGYYIYLAFQVGCILLQIKHLIFPDETYEWAGAILGSFWLASIVPPVLFLVLISSFVKKQLR